MKWVGKGTTGRSCGGSPLGDFKLARMKAPRAGGTKMVRCGWGSVCGMVQVKNAVNYSFRQKFEP